MKTPAGTLSDLVEALREDRVERFDVAPDSTVSVVWRSGSGKSGRSGIPLHALLGEILRECV